MFFKKKKLVKVSCVTVDVKLQKYAWINVWWKRSFSSQWKHRMKQWGNRLLMYAYSNFIWVENQHKQRISWNSKTHTKNFVYGETPVRRAYFTAKFPYGEISVRQNFLRWNFFTAKFPYGDISLRWNFLRRNFLPLNLLRRNFRSRTILTCLRLYVWWKI